MSGFHFIHPMSPQKRKAKPWVIVDIETNGLDAGKYVFGVMMYDNGEYEVHHDPVTLRDSLEAYAPCIVYAHNAFGFDLWAFYTRDEIKQSVKLWKGTKLLMVRVNKVEWRDSKDLMQMRLSDIGDALGMPKGETPIEYILGTVEEVRQEDIDYCVLDCRILLSALLMLRDQYQDWCGADYPVDLPLTIASLAYRVWSSTEWPEHWGYFKDE